MTKPYTCPVCHGNGVMPTPQWPMAFTSRPDKRPCHPCRGEGVLWGPMEGSPLMVGDPNTCTTSHEEHGPVSAPKTFDFVNKPAPAASLSAESFEGWLENALAEMRALKAKHTVIMSGRRSGMAAAMNKAVGEPDSERQKEIKRLFDEGSKKAAEEEAEPEPMDVKHHVCAMCGHPMSRWSCTDHVCKGFKKAPDAERDYPTGPPVPQTAVERLEDAGHPMMRPPTDAEREECNRAKGETA